jgi:hypothetical protein
MPTTPPCASSAKSGGEAPLVQVGNAMAHLMRLCYTRARNRESGPDLARRFGRPLQQARGVGGASWRVLPECPVRRKQRGQSSESGLVEPATTPVRCGLEQLAAA